MNQESATALAYAECQIDGTLTVLHLATAMIALGLVAALILIRRKDMQASDSPEQHAAG